MIEKIKEKRIVAYLFFVIVSVVIPIGIYLLNENESFLSGCVFFIPLVISLILYYFVLKISTKEAGLLLIAPIVIGIACLLLGYTKIGGYYFLIFLLYPAFLFAFIRNENYKKKEEKRKELIQKRAMELNAEEEEEEEEDSSEIDRIIQERKNAELEFQAYQKELENERQQKIINKEINQQNKNRNEQIIKHNEYNHTREIIINGLPYQLHYHLDDNEKDSQLIKLGDYFDIRDIGFNDIDSSKIVGDDDTSSFEISFKDNHAIVDRFGDNYWYFDINDLSSVTIDEAHFQYLINEEYSGSITHYFLLKFKDGTEKEFGGFDNYDDVMLFKECLKSINNNIKIIEKDSFGIDRPGFSENDKDFIYSIKEDNIVIKLINEEVVGKITLNDIKEKNIMGDHAILIKNDGHIYELAKVDNITINKLNN